MIHKPLPVNEQSWLLVAMLFARTSLVDLLQFFPEKQQERMKAPLDRFLKLPRQKRITLAILELKRLFMLSENPLAHVHPSWIDAHLDLEPDYLVEIVRSQATLEKRPVTPNGGGNPRHRFLLQCFASSIVEAPLRKPIFEPLLIRLTSIEEAMQGPMLSALGQQLSVRLGEFYHKNRWAQFLARRGLVLDSKDAGLLAGNNPFAEAGLRTFCLRFALTQKPQEFAVSIALATIACYLNGQKPSWRQSFKFGLHMRYGLLLSEALTLSQTLKFDPETNRILGTYLVGALEKF
jgi:hypothetical protein